MWPLLNLQSAAAISKVCQEVSKKKTTNICTHSTPILNSFQVISMGSENITSSNKNLTKIEWTNGIDCWLRSGLDGIKVWNSKIADAMKEYLELSLELYTSTAD
jgi:hypothetical protein